MTDGAVGDSGRSVLAAALLAAAAIGIALLPGYFAPQVPAAADLTRSTATPATSDLPTSVMDGFPVSVDEPSAHENLACESTADEAVDPSGRLPDVLDARLRANADPAVQAAALLIGVRTRPDESSQRIDALVRLATGVRDARVYAIAEEGCRDQRDDPASTCHLLQPEQWAQLDPGNAVPWLALAERARTQGDAASEDEAMYRAARARHSDLRQALLPSLVAQGLLGTPPRSPLRSLGLAASWQVQTAWSLSATTQAMHYCWADDRVVADADRMTTCDQLAHLLAETSSSPIDAATARAIGRRLRWPAVRLDDLTARTDLLGAAIRQQRATEGPGCPRRD